MEEVSSNEERLRMIAGPNGSGKSTFFTRLQQRVSTGIWINADEILFELERRGFIDYDWLGFSPQPKLWNAFNKLESSIKFISIFNLEGSLQQVLPGAFNFSVGKKNVSNQLAAYIADFFRFCLLQHHKSFTTETVFSHPSKLDLVKEANQASYKTYLYFIATEDPSLNISRIKGRTEKGGHSVPPDIVRARYSRSIQLMADSLQLFYRVYLFDNSSLSLNLLAGFQQGTLIERTQSLMPGWAKIVL